MSTGRRTFWQLQVCNGMLCLFGVLLVGLAGTQFTLPFALPNTERIDLRLLVGFLAVLAGCMGSYCVGRHHGGIVIKTLYIVVIVVGLGTTGFYAFTTYRVLILRAELENRERMGLQSSGYGNLPVEISMEYTVKAIVAILAVALSALEALAAVIAAILLERLAVIERPWTPVIPADEDQLRLRRNRAKFVTLAVVKLVAGAGAVGLAAWTEFLLQSTASLERNFIRVALDHLAGLLAIASAITDFYAAFTQVHRSLNLKVGIALSLVAGTWCLKSVDNNMTSFLKQDIANLKNRDLQFVSLTNPYVLTLVVHAGLVALLVLLVLLCGASAIMAVSCLFEPLGERASSRPGRRGRRTTKTNGGLPQISTTTRTRYENVPPGHARARGRARARGECCLGTSHVLWAFCLGVLAAVGLWDPNWTGDFHGGDLVWLAVLALSTCLLGSSDNLTNARTKFVLNTSSLAIAVEKLCVAVNLVYQAVTYQVYQDAQLRAPKTYVGQIVLNVATLMVLTGWTITCISGTLIFGRELASEAAIRGQYRHGKRYGLSCCWAFGTLFYGLVLTATYAIFEFARWHYGEVPVDVYRTLPFFRLGNGPLGLAVFIVQVAAVFRPHFLVVAMLLQTVLTALALFTLSPAITNLYYLQTIFYRTFYPSTSFGTGLQQQQLSMLGPTMTQQEQNILVVGVVLAALVTLACVVQAVTGVLCTLRSSFLVHWQQQNDGDASSELVWTTYESSPVGTSGNDGGQRRRNSTGGGGGRGGPAISPPSHTSTLPFDDGAGYGHYGGPGSARAARINHAFGANPAVHQIAIRPIEEQTLYWSAEEEPHIYKSTKRVYREAYPVDDGMGEPPESGYGGSPVIGGSGAHGGYFYNSSRDVPPTNVTVPSGQTTFEAGVREQHQQEEEDGEEEDVADRSSPASPVITITTVPAAGTGGETGTGQWRQGQRARVFPVNESAAGPSHRNGDGGGTNNNHNRRSVPL